MSEDIFVYRQLTIYLLIRRKYLYKWLFSVASVYIKVAIQTSYRFYI